MRSLYIIIAMILVVSCSEEEPSLRGDLIIFVSSYDIQGEEQFDVSGIEVSLLETGKTLATNEYGRVLFENVSTSEYNVKISREDFGEVEKPLVFLGGGAPDIRNFSLFESPEVDDIFLAEIDTVFSSTDNYPTLYFTLKSDSPFNAVAFAGADAVDKDHYLIARTISTPLFDQLDSMYELSVYISTSSLNYLTNEQEGYIRFYVTNIANRNDHFDQNIFDFDALIPWGEVMMVDLDY